MSAEDFPTYAFPSPKCGNIKRPLGEGCSSCVHRRYCDPYRYLVAFGTVVDDTYGVACESWSNKKEDIVTQWTEDDKRRAERNYYEGYEQWETSIIKKEL